MSNEVAQREQRILLRGLVTNVLNAREVVINLGARDGVRSGMKFRVVSDVPLEVHDPETEELLGTIEREKVRVQAVEIQERLAICRTYRSRTIPGGYLTQMKETIPSLRDPYAPSKTVTETLRASASAFPAPLAEEDSFVKRGDQVVQTADDEQE